MIASLSNNHLCNIFGHEVTVFGIALAIGVLLLGLIYITKLRKMKIDEKQIDKFVILAAIVGALTYLSAVFIDGIWHEISNAEAAGRAFNLKNALPLISHNGMTFEGGIICGLGFFAAGMELFMKKYRHMSLYFVDILTLCIPLAHFWGRVGCFHAGCCYGKTIDEIPSWLQWLTIPYSVNGETPINRVPTQLIEAIFVLLLFVVLFFFVKKRRTEVYLITYGIYRFLAEYLRGDSRGSSPFGALSPSQFTSIIMIAIGIWCIFWRNLIDKKIKSGEYQIPEGSSSAFYANTSLKNFFKCLFTKDVCDKCGKKKTIGIETTYYVDDNLIPALNNEFVTICKDCENIPEEENKSEE